MPSKGGLDDLWRSVDRLNDVFNTVVKSSQMMAQSLHETEKQNSEIVRENQLKNRLRDDLSNVQSTTVLIKKLNEVLSKKLGGSASSDIKENLEKANYYKRRADQEFKKSKYFDELSDKIMNKMASVNNPKQLASLQSQLNEAVKKEQAAYFARQKFARASQAALTRSHAAALGTEGGINAEDVATTKIGGLGKAAGIAAIVIQAGTKIVDMFNDKLSEAGSIVAKYGRFSGGGLHALAIIQYRDMQRNIKSSNEASGEMIAFAKAASDARDSFRSTNLFFERTTLKISEGIYRLGEKLGKAIDPAFKALSDLFFGPQRQQMLDRQMRRRHAFATGDASQLEPGDLHPLEAGLLPNAVFANIPGHKAPPNAAKRNPGANPQQGPAGPVGQQGAPPNPGQPKQPQFVPPPPVPGNVPAPAPGAGPAIPDANGPIDKKAQILAQLDDNIAFLEDRIKKNFVDIEKHKKDEASAEKKIKGIEEGGVLPEEKAAFDLAQKQKARASKQVDDKSREYVDDKKRLEALQGERDNASKMNNAWNAPGANSFGNFSGPGRIGFHLMDIV